MEIVEVKIKGIVMTAKYGTLSNGDILRTDPAFARHLVEDCQAAEYTGAAVAPARPKSKAAAKKKGGAA